MSISVKSVSFGYEKQKLIIEDITFEAETGKVMCVLGPNGAGKSTLFRCILGLLSKYSGEIRIGGMLIDTLKPKELSRLAAYVPQSHIPVFSYTVYDIVLMGTSSMTHAFSVPGKKENEAVLTALEMTGTVHLKERSFLQISGGERQLVLIARALAQQAKVLVLDEPTANLDFGNQVKVLTQLKRLAENGYTIIQSTHHPDQAFLYADSVLAMQGGRILCKGKPEDIITGETIKALYDVDAQVETLYGGRARVCIPNDLL